MIFKNLLYRFRESWKKTQIIVFNSESFFFIAVTVVVGLSVLFLDTIDKEFSFHDILVELNGFVFDLIVLGVILSIYNYVRAKKERIINLKNELDDFKGWNEKEAMFRNVGIIRRLNRDGIAKIELTFSYLVSADLSNTDLKGSILHGNDLSNANFDKANLSETSLAGAKFCQANLYRVNLEKARIVCADFEGADLRVANFTNAVIIDTNFNGANFYQAIFKNATFITHNTSFVGANLKQADLSGVNLSNVDLSKANLIGANLSETNLSNANLVGADLTNAILSGTDLSNAKTEGCKLS
jgi:uncharacterized protein YjbI with pentapeptide repeats